MFEDVPERLTAAVRAARSDFLDANIYVMAAGLVIIEYVRKMIDDPEKPNEFLANKKNETGGLDRRHTVRTTNIGESLFAAKELGVFRDLQTHEGC